jgi:Flp pilus assembly protein CpaB
MDFAEKLLATRRGTVLLGIAAAVLAAILLVVYLNRYRASFKSSNVAAQVLVAQRLIQAGAPGNLIASGRQFQVASIAKGEVRPGAITDPSTLRGLVATRDIYGGQQLTMADFTTAAPDALQTKLTGTDRAIQLPFDAPHGLTGQIQAGDHVDVYALLNVQGPTGTHPSITQLMDNALVLRTPATGAASGTVVLRGKGLKTAELAWASDNGKLWLVLRPASGAKPVKPGLVTLQGLLLGTRPVR